MRETETNRLISQTLKTPDPLILSKIKSTKWTSHNIPVACNESTMDNQPLTTEDVRIQTIKKSIYRLFCQRNSLKGLRLIDLGCLEGGISLEMAREDMSVVGVEGRESNFAKCKLIEDLFKLPHLDFIFLDVKKLNKEEHGIFDIVLCLGLLYHLENPVSFLGILKKITHDKSIIFLDTHIAPVDDEALSQCEFKGSLSEVTHICHDGITYAGRWYQEYPEENGHTNDEWAAVSNYRSFWLTQKSLFKALYHSGFRDIYKLYGVYNVDEEYQLRYKYSRLWCITFGS